MFFKNISLHPTLPTFFEFKKECAILTTRTKRPHVLAKQRCMVRASICCTLPVLPPAAEKPRFLCETLLRRWTLRTWSDDCPCYWTAAAVEVFGQDQRVHQHRRHHHHCQGHSGHYLHRSRPRSSRAGAPSSCRSRSSSLALVVILFRFPVRLAGRLAVGKPPTLLCLLVRLRPRQLSPKRRGPDGPETAHARPC